MSLFSFFPSADRNSKKKARRKNQRNLLLESLESRALPSAVTISGYVYQDSNNSGLFEPGETPLANSNIQLTNNQGVVIGTATTDASGHYEFLDDQTVTPADQTLTKTVTFPTTLTDFNLQGALDQFDPSLGQLESIDITHAGSITSEIKVENTSDTSTSQISGTVAGQLELTAPGVDDKLALSQYAGSFNASVFDGDVDFSGQSGTSFGVKNADGSDDIQLTGSQLTPYIGTGQVQVTETGDATSNASGGGNLATKIDSSGEATITVVYHYQTLNAIKPGSYTITQVTQPPGYLPGKLSADGSVLSTPVDTRVIQVNFDGTNDSSNNNFAELLPGSISGFVYSDANNDGTFQSTEGPISGVTVTLTGTDDQGNAVTQTTTTDNTGAYSFSNLRTGTYTVNETQPTGWLDGKTTAGNLGGTATDDQIANIALPQDGQSVQNNFGELKPAGLSGFVYFDANASGTKDAGDQAIPNVTLTLTGAGGATQTTTTAPDGSYSFENLVPGTYTLTESQPANYGEAKDNVGSLGGDPSTQDVFANINVTSGAEGTDYDFGEIQPTSIAGHVYIDSQPDGVRDTGDPPIPNVTLTLSGTDINGNAVSATTTTAPDGTYSFNNLTPGTYQVSESQPAGYQQGTNAAGSLGGTVNGDVISAIPVTMGDNGVNYDFGEINPNTADIGIVKTADASQNSPNDLLTYTLTVTNYGPVTAQKVVVTDTLPPDVTYVGFSAPGWDSNFTGPTFILAKSSMTAGETDTLKVTVRVPDHADTLTNNVDVTSKTPDSNPNNNHSQVTTTVVNTPGVVQTQSIPPLRVNVNLPIIGKNQLFNDGGDQYIDPALKANAAFVDGVYQTLTGASGSSDAEMDALAGLQQGTLTRAQFVQQVMGSDAHLTSQSASFSESSVSPAATPSQIVDQTFRDTLRRPATQAEINLYSAQINSGSLTASELAARLLASAEFYQLAYNAS